MYKNRRTDSNFKLLAGIFREFDFLFFINLCNFLQSHFSSIVKSTKLFLHCMEQITDHFKVFLLEKKKKCRKWCMMKWYEVKRIITKVLSVISVSKLVFSI